MDIINGTSEMGIIFEYLTINITGSIYLSLLAVFLVIMALAIVARIPIEWTALIMFPLALAITAYYTTFLPVLGMLIFYAAILMAKYFFYK